MSEDAKAHQKLAVRLAYLLIKLNSGEAVNCQVLVDRFGVNLRTAQRDFERLRQAIEELELGGGLQKIGAGSYQLAPSLLGKYSAQHIRRFAEISGIPRLFPRIENGHLANLLNSNSDALVVKQWPQEDLSEHANRFQDLKKAIEQCRLISFCYKTKFRDAVKPYKLLNQKGIWYLAAVEQNQMKSFAFAQISLLDVSANGFTPDPEQLALVNSEGCGWVGQPPTRFRFHVAAPVAEYFRRRPLIQNQVLERELVDGGLIVQAEVRFVVQALSVVRYWIPHVVILEPVGLQAQLEAGLRDYLDQRERPDPRLIEY